jgi:hypothetical protein
MTTNKNTQSVSLSRSDYLKLGGLIITPAIAIMGFMLGFMWTTSSRLAILETNQLMIVEMVRDLKNGLGDHVKTPTHPGSATRLDIDGVRQDVNDLRRIIMEQKNARFGKS